ncbi:hypothetical protein LCGC14_2969860, partial [marine sediment metagenome]
MRAGNTALFGEFALELHRLVQQWRVPPLSYYLQYGGEKMKAGSPPPRNAKSVTDRLPRKVKRHFLESELKTANDLAREYVDSVSEHTCEECGSGLD